MEQQVRDKLGISERQVGILRFIERFRDEHGYPPSLREIAAGVGLASSSSAFYHIGVLEELGLLNVDRGVIGTSRTYRVTSDGLIATRR